MHYNSSNRAGRGRRWADADMPPERPLANGKTRIDFQTEPARYRHWKLAVDGDVATLTMDVDEKGALFEGYELKLNSYDLGVDIELADAIDRLRFEHPQVRVVVLRSGKPRVFCAGANIRMLAGATHAHKVNFCKFTNETRNGIEDFARIPGSHRSARSTALRPAADMNSRSPPITSCWSTTAGGGVAAGTAAVRGSARHRRPHARVRQAQSAARPRRRVLHHRRRRQRQARGGVAAGRRRGAGLEIRRDRWARAREFAAKSRRNGTGCGIKLDATDADLCGGRR